MLGCDDDAYLVARALQFFVPGIPQVYYVGLLAGKNDVSEASSTLDGREINRHNYSIREIERDAQHPVVRNLIRLIRFRNSHPAFNGTFYTSNCSDHEISLGWNANSYFTRLNIDLQLNRFEIRYNDGLSGKENVLALER
jgi:sucrose phosphorylase